MQQSDILKELGLSPVWVRKSAAAAAVAAEAAEAAAQHPAGVAGAGAVAASSADSAAVRVPADIPVEKMSWQQLRSTVERCRLCTLCEGRTKTAFGTGDTQARVMFVGEGPGREEDMKGEPFVGQAGKLLDLMLHSIGLSRTHEVYIANIVKCRPPNNRNPQSDEVQSCMPYLQRQIAMVQPEVLVALGRVAAAHLLKTDASIAQMRQKMHEYEKTPMVVTYHPAYLLREPQEKRKAWDDLVFLRQLLAR